MAEGLRSDKNTPILQYSKFETLNCIRDTWLYGHSKFGMAVRQPRLTSEEKAWLFGQLMPML